MDSVIAGFRSNDCVVRELRLFSVKKMHHDARDVIGEECWKPNVCFNFLQKFLQHLKDTIVDASLLYVFEFDPQKGHILMQTRSSESSAIFGQFFGDVNVELCI